MEIVRSENEINDLLNKCVEVRSENEINDLLNKCVDAIDEGSRYPGMSYEQGISEL